MTARSVAGSFVNRERQGTIHNIITRSLFFTAPSLRGREVVLGDRGLDDGLAA